MTKEDKDLLIKDLLARLPYNIKVLHYQGSNCILKSIDLRTCAAYVEVYDFMALKDFIQDGQRTIFEYKPYLRPISSMTKEERAEMGTVIQKDRIDPYGEIKNFGEDNLLLCTIRQSTNLQDWLNKKMFDYRGLIPMGLALESPEGMYIL